MTKTRQSLITIVVIVLATALIVGLLPRGGYDSNVSQVGDGQPAVVLVFENYAPASMDAMALLDRVRSDHGERILFLVADLGTPRGRAFAERHNGFSGLVLTFTADGSLVGRGMLEHGEAGLRERLRRELGS